MTDRDKLIEAMAAALADEEGLRPTEHSRRWVRQAKAALSAIVANGFAVVPVEPSAVQIAAGWRYAFQQSAQCYRAMIAAAPMQGDG
jgi:hypothetical protein